MTLFILIALTVTLFVYLVRVIQLEGNNPNVFVVVPLVLGIMLTGVMEYQWSSAVDKGTNLVIYVSGVTNASLDCQRMMGTFYDWTPDQKASISTNDPTTVHMKYAECMDLMSWFNSDKTSDEPTSEQAEALHLLVFEANKLNKLSDADAECKTDKQYVDVAEYGGATPEEAQHMMDMFNSDWQPQLPDSQKQPCP